MVWRLGFQRMVLLLTALAGSVYAVFLLRGQVMPAAEKEALAFPASITEDLTVRLLTGYDGPFLEDGSMEEVVDTAALVLENTGLRHIGKVTIRLCTSDGNMVFTAFHIPPQSKLLVLESEKKTYTGDSVWQMQLEELVYSSNLLQWELTALEEGTGITVTNLTQTTVHGAVLYFKQYDEASQMYIGGAARSYSLDTLTSKETVIISPPGFIVPYCRVAAIEAESP